MGIEGHDDRRRSRSPATRREALDDPCMAAVQAVKIASATRGACQRGGLESSESE